LKQIEFVALAGGDRGSYTDDLAVQLAVQLAVPLAV